MASTILEQILENVSRGARLPDPDGSEENSAAPATPSPAPVPAPAPPMRSQMPSADPDALMRVVIDEVDLRLARLVERVLGHPALKERPQVQVDAPTFLSPDGTEPIDVARAARYSAEALTPVNPRRASENMGKTDAVDPMRVPAWETPTISSRPAPSPVPPVADSGSREGPNTGTVIAGERESESARVDEEPAPAAASEPPASSLEDDATEIEESTDDSDAEPDSVEESEVETPPVELVTESLEEPESPEAESPDGVESSLAEPELSPTAEAFEEVVGDVEEIQLEWPEPETPDGEPSLTDLEFDADELALSEPTPDPLAEVDAPATSSYDVEATGDPEIDAVPEPSPAPACAEQDGEFEAFEDTDEVAFQLPAEEILDVLECAIGAPEHEITAKDGAEDPAEDVIEPVDLTPRVTVAAAAVLPKALSALPEEEPRAVSPQQDSFRAPPVVNIRPGVDVVRQVEEIVEEIATTCASGPESGESGSSDGASALDEIRGLLAPLQQIPELLEQRSGPGDEILRQVQSLAREVRDMASAPRPAAAETPEVREEVSKQRAERRRVAIDDIQGMIESLT